MINLGNKRIIIRVVVYYVYMSQCITYILRLCSGFEFWIEYTMESHRIMGQISSKIHYHAVMTEIYNRAAMIRGLCQKIMSEDYDRGL